MSYIIKLFILTIFYINTSCKIQVSKVVAAINCGGDEYTDSNGVKYEADQYFNGGTQSDHGLSYTIKNTDDELLYQTERWSSKTLTYSLPLKSNNINGKYVLILKFSEVYFNMKGEKVFNVALGKENVIKNLDIFGKVGKAEALDEYVEFEIKNKQVFYKNKNCKEALDGDKLKVNFLKGSADNPKINAILLIKGTLKDTDYPEKQKKNEENRKKKMRQLRKEELINLRHDADELYNEEQLSDENFTIKKDTGFFSIFSSPLGIYIGGSLVLFAMLNFLIDKIF